MDDDDDNVLIGLATELSTFDQYVPATSIHNVILSLGDIAKADVGMVRQAAIDGIIKVGSNLTPGRVCDNIIGGLVGRLTTSDSYNHRLGACGLYAFAYKVCSESYQPCLLSDFSSLVADKVQIVRRNAAIALEQLASEINTVGNGDHVTLCVKWFNDLGADAQDHIRMHNAASGPMVSQIIRAHIDATSPEPFKALKLAAADESWRVRVCVAKVFPAWVSSFTTPTTTPTSTQTVDGAACANILRSLLTDPEPEVRAVATTTLPDALPSLPSPGPAIIVPVITQLTRDSVQHVRGAVASVLCEIAALKVVTAAELDRVIKPSILALIGPDQPAEVRMAILQSVEPFVGRVGRAAIDHYIVSAITSMAGEKAWLIRSGLTKLGPSIARLFIENDIIEFSGSGTEVKKPAEQSAVPRSIASILLTNLADPVEQVRVASCDALVEMVDILGPDWVTGRAVVRLTDLLKHPKYLYRITSLKCIAALAPVVDASVLSDPTHGLTQAVVGLVTTRADKVPNVRLNAATTLSHLGENLEGHELSRIRTVLRDMVRNEGDADVREAIEAALRRL